MCDVFTSQICAWWSLKAREFVLGVVVPQIRCVHTGYYQNPKDCTQFVACLFDHNTRTKVSRGSIVFYTHQSISLLVQIAEFAPEFLCAENPAKNTDIWFLVFFYLKKITFVSTFEHLCHGLNSLLHAFSAELPTVILCRLLVTVITRLVENGQQSNSA